MCTYVYKICMHTLSHVWLFETPRSAACQAPLSIGFSRQGYWSRLPFPSPDCLPDPGTKFLPLEPPELAGRFCTSWAIEEAHIIYRYKVYIYLFIFLLILQSLEKLYLNDRCLVSSNLVVFSRVSDTSLFIKSLKITFVRDKSFSSFP